MKCFISSVNIVNKEIFHCKTHIDGQVVIKNSVFLQTIHDALDCPYPILRAIYEHNGKDRDKLLEEVQRRYVCCDPLRRSCDVVSIVQRKIFRKNLKIFISNHI